MAPLGVGVDVFESSLAKWKKSHIGPLSKPLDNGFANGLVR